MSTQSHTVVNCGIDSGGIYHTTYLVQSQTVRSILVHGINFVGTETRPISILQESDDDDMDVAYTRIIGMLWLRRIDHMVLLSNDGIGACVHIFSVRYGFSNVYSVIPDISFSIVLADTS
jgi:hypothetical protein